MKKELFLLVCISLLSMLNNADADAGKKERQTFLTDSIYSNCFISGCHVPNNSNHPGSPDIAPDDCSSCHAPKTYLLYYNGRALDNYGKADNSIEPNGVGRPTNDKNITTVEIPLNNLVAPVHTPDFVGRIRFKGNAVCTRCHETGMQNKIDNPNLNCLTCHAPGTKGDVHGTIRPHGEGDKGMNSAKNPNIALDTGGHRMCFNCHFLQDEQDLTEYYLFHLDGYHLSTSDPSILDPSDPAKSCNICHMDPRP